MGCAAQEKDFSFWFPVDFLKSDPARPEEWRVGGVASDEEAEDLQGEMVFIKGLDTSYLTERGVFNWDHGKEPGDIVGEIDKAERQGNDTKLWVEGFLYPDVRKAQDVKSLIDSLKKCGSKRRLGMSLEGKVKERDGANGKLIKKAWIKAVALTYNPINKGTFADFIKSLGKVAEYSPCNEDCAKCASACAVEKAVENKLGPIGPVGPSCNVGMEVKKGVEKDDKCPLCEGGPHINNDVCPKAGKPEEPKVTKAEVVKAEGCGGSSEGLQAGHDIPASSGGVSGSALRKESLETDKKVTTYQNKDLKKKKKIKKGDFINIIVQKGYTEKAAEELWQLFAKREIRDVNLDESPMNRKDAIEFLHKSKGYSRRISAQLADMAILQKNAGTAFEVALGRALEKGKKFSPDVYKHPDKGGEGAKKRKGLNPKDKVHAVMGEFKRKTLHTGTGKKGVEGPVVQKRDQAIAIAMSESGQSKDKKD